MAELAPHLAAVLGLALLCGVWVLVQAWIARRDPEQPGVEGSRCGRGCEDGECARGAAGLCRERGGERPPLRVLGLWILLLAGSCSSPGVSIPPPGDVGEYATFTFDVMSTTLRVTVPASLDAEGETDPERVAEAVLKVFRRVEEVMNEWRPGSPLAEVNRRAGETVAVPRELASLLDHSREIARLTDGAFDPTWAALWGLWDFRAAEPRVPPAAAIAERLPLVDWRRLHVDVPADTVRLETPGMQVGLGGIAKGWALLHAAAELTRLQVESYLITAGGQVLAGGVRHGAEGDRPWRVGVRDPRGAGAEDYFATLELTSGESLSTSGDYESFFLVGGERYHHILDPRTGYPARGLAGVTVVSSDPTLADALSTALMVLGPERGLELARRLPEAEALLVTPAGEVLLTPGLEPRLTMGRRPGRGR